MSESIQVSAVLPAKPARVYQAWMNGKEHGAFTGGKAVIDPGIGGKFTAWDGYIEGTTVELVPGKKIVQKWRTTDFPGGSADSLLEIILEDDDGGTKITINHTEIPDGQGEDYKEGWIDYYFEPMKIFFEKEE